MKRTNKWIMLAVVIGLCCCEPDTECRITESVRCRVVFRCDSLQDGVAVAFSTLDSVTVWGVDADTVLYANAKRVSALSLPLKREADKTEYAMVLNGREDTLTIWHRNREYFVSLACGCFVYHEVDSAGGRTITGEVLNTAVENMEQDNVRLYVHF